ncbi:hypothetical protein Save01_08299 [Streptomyces avermitilis]
MAPMNTPVSLPRSDPGSIPASSSVSQAVSRSSRCCGSIASASRGDTPKNPASKPAMSSRNPPCRTYVRPEVSGSGSNRLSRSQPRSRGSPDTASRPDRTSSHRASGDDTPPGNRQPIPTMAIGSSASPSRNAGTLGAPSASPCPVSSACRNAANRSGVGWSNTSDPGRARPSSEDSPAHSSTAVSDVRPRSLNDVSGVMSAASYPRTAARWVRTRSSRLPRSWTRAGSAAGAASRASPIQCRRRWKAYVGSTTLRPPSNSGVQSTGAPVACRVPSALSRVRTSACPVRSVATAAGACSARVSRAMPASTGSGPSSR